MTSIKTSGKTSRKSKIPVRQDADRYSSRSQSPFDEIENFPHSIITAPKPNPRTNLPTQIKAEVYKEIPKKPTEFDHISV